MKRTSIALAILLASPLQTLAQSATEQEKQAAVFLERVLRPWSLVVKPWNRDVTEAEWATARTDCVTPKAVADPMPVGEAEDKLPPRSELLGSTAFYRGAIGLQSVDIATGKMEVFPNVQVGRSQNGAPAYQISNDERTIQIAMGKVPAGEESAVVMLFDGGLYLSCRQPADDQ